jgi:hypothetical protein
VGAFFYGASGTPLSTYVNTVHRIPVFVEGRGDLGRTDVLTRTDLLVSHELKLAGSKRIRAELNVLNLFNQQTSRHIFNSLNRGAGLPRDSAGMDLSAVDLRNGYDYRALLLASPDGTNAADPRFGRDDLFDTGTTAYFTFKFLF